MELLIWLKERLNTSLSRPYNLKVHIAVGNPSKVSDCVPNVTQMCAVLNIDEQNACSTRARVVNSNRNNDSNDTGRNNYYNKNFGRQNSRRKIDVSLVTCYRCEEYGGYARFCTKSDEEVREIKKKKAEQGNDEESQ